MARKKADAEVEVKAVEDDKVVAEDTQVVEAPKEESTVTEEVKVEKVEVDGEVVAEFTHQLGIFSEFIYNAKNEDVTLIVENLGYGDIYVSEKNNVRVGDEGQRVLFKEQKVFKGATKLHFTSASQPVVSIIEVK